MQGLYMKRNASFNRYKAQKKSLSPVCQWLQSFDMIISVDRDIKQQQKQMTAKGNLGMVGVIQN